MAKNVSPNESEPGLPKITVEGSERSSDPQNLPLEPGLPNYTGISSPNINTPNSPPNINFRNQVKEFLNQVKENMKLILNQVKENMELILFSILLSFGIGVALSNENYSVTIWVWVFIIAYFILRRKIRINPYFKYSLVLPLLILILWIASFSIYSSIAIYSILYLSIAGYLSYQQSRGTTYDKHLTMFLFVFFAGVYATSIYEFGSASLLSMMYFTFITFWIGVIMITRFFKISIIKIVGWAMGLISVVFTIFTYNNYSYAHTCEQKKDGIQDPLYITLLVYAGWLIISGLSFYFEGKRHWRYFFLITLLVMAILNYTWKRCEDTEKQPTWIKNSATLNQMFAWVNMFSGHHLSSFISSLSGYAILDQCRHEDKSSLLLISVMLINPVFFILKSGGKRLYDYLVKIKKMKNINKIEEGFSELKNRVLKNFIRVLENRVKKNKNISKIKEVLVN